MNSFTPGTNKVKNNSQKGKRALQPVPASKQNSKPKNKEKVLNFDGTYFIIYLYYFQECYTQGVRMQKRKYDITDYQELIRQQ